jgi:RNA polymerase sigma factor (sigma-70 family)
MPFRDIEKRDKETGKVVEVIKEQFPKYYLSNESEEHALAMRRWYKGYITWLAGKYSKNSGVDHSDLVDEAYLGLARAVRDFRPEAGKITNKNPKFHNFAVQKIREALREGVYTGDTPVHIPYRLREVHYYLTRIANIINDLYLDNGVEEDTVLQEDVDLANLGIPKEYVEQINYFKAIIANKAHHADTTYEKIVERARKIPRRQFVEDFHNLEYEETAYEVDDERLDKFAAFERMSKVLDDREYKMLMDYELDGFTVEMLKDKYNVSIGRVSQILTKARDKIQKSEGFIKTGKHS